MIPSPTRHGRERTAGRGTSRSTPYCHAASSALIPTALRCSKSLTVICATCINRHSNSEESQTGICLVTCGIESLPLAKKTTVFSCRACGAQSPKWLGRCPECNGWNTHEEETTAKADVSRVSRTGDAHPPVSIDSIRHDSLSRISTGILDFDRVLGGGLVPGGVVLVGGEPGVGKSTLLLQAAQGLAQRGPVLYVSGEESPIQVAMRGRRMAALHPQILLYAETSVEAIIEQLRVTAPAVVIIDSIQTLHTDNSASPCGSVAQVRDSAGMLLAEAKRSALPMILIGHITKDGTIAGPKVLEHIVDTVLYFEGDRLQNHRILRTFKNRFGPANEIGIFAMHDSGLEEVPNPSAMLLAQRSAAPGSAIAAAIEGTRPLLVEIQALVAPTHFPSPRRTAIGFDPNRVSLLQAVLEKRVGSSFATRDTWVNVAGGIELDEPAADLAVIAALLSSEENRPLRHSLALFGEVGLLGEVRAVSQPDTRAREAAAHGLTTLIVPETNAREITADVEVVPVKRVEDLPRLLFGLERGGHRNT